MSEQPAQPPQPAPLDLGMQTLLELAVGPEDRAMVIVIRNNPDNRGSSTSWASRGVNPSQCSQVLTELAAKFAIRAEKEAASE